LEKYYVFMEEMLTGYIASEIRKKTRTIKDLREDISSLKRTQKNYRKMIAELTKPPKPFKMPKLTKSQARAYRRMAIPVAIPR
jgi:predicted RNase H-like nuclease (RuvC/YqgF family)